MFFTRTDEKRIHDALMHLSSELDKANARIAALEAQIILNDVAPHGFKKNGEPKKKPGRKVVFAESI